MLSYRGLFYRLVVPKVQFITRIRRITELKQSQNTSEEMSESPVSFKIERYIFNKANEGRSGRLHADDETKNRKKNKNIT